MMTQRPADQDPGAIGPSITLSFNSTSYILPLSINSGQIPFTDWVALFTLCLAPLIAHIAAGAPTPTVLADTSPTWHDLAVLYNPTSVLWRYFAITDRRLRARAWSPGHVSAANAIFWTLRGWDGSEEMVASSFPYIAQLPERSRVILLSASSLKSLIVAIQGLSALWLLVGNLTGGFYAASLAVDSIFGPLAVFGLLRLCAAFWLIEYFVYSYIQVDNGDKTQENENATLKRFAMHSRNTMLS